MPPELYIFELAKLSTKVDIWSYGMILYETITGEVIINSNTQKEG